MRTGIVINAGDPLAQVELAVRAEVLDSPKGPRLVIIESDRIVQWETFRLTRDLRSRAIEIRRELRKAGWVAKKN